MVGVGANKPHLALGVGIRSCVCVQESGKIEPLSEGFPHPCECGCEIVANGIWALHVCVVIFLCQGLSWCALCEHGPSGVLRGHSIFSINWCPHRGAFQVPSFYAR